MDNLLQQKDYPKIEEYHRRQKRLEIKKKFIEGMSVKEFLEYFEDPEKVRHGCAFVLELQNPCKTGFLSYSLLL